MSHKCTTSLITAPAITCILSYNKVYFYLRVVLVRVDLGRKTLTRLDCILYIYCAHCLNSNSNVFFLLSLTIKCENQH